MSDFRTEIQILPSIKQISHKDSLFLVGSCFAEHIGAKLRQYKFPLLENPFGILYNPLSILRFFQSIAEKKTYSYKDLELNDGIYCHFDAHGRLNDPNPDIICQNLNASIEHSLHQILQASWLVISLGTSFYYEHNDSQRIVANCHKFPASDFSRKRLSLKKNYQAITSIYLIAKKLNPDINLLFTVSPVRHIRDGLQENQLSKAALLLAVDQLQKSEDRVLYFPSYELMLDDLRDYRFYTADMLHPNDQAINYIWKKFESSLIHPESRKINTEIRKIMLGMNHRAFHPRSENHIEFLKKLMKRIEKFEAEYPFLQFSKEKEAILKQFE